MDASAMYPEGFHPSWQDRSKDSIAFTSKYIRRADTSVKYVFVDFGESTFFRSPDDGPPLVTGARALDHDVPELNNFGIAYNPYLVDVFTLGNVYKKHFCSVSNLEFT